MLNALNALLQHILPRRMPISMQHHEDSPKPSYHVAPMSGYGSDPNGKWQCGKITGKHKYPLPMANCLLYRDATSTPLSHVLLLAHIRFESYPEAESTSCAANWPPSPLKGQRSSLTSRSRSASTLMCSPSPDHHHPLLCLDRSGESMHVQATAARTKTHTHS